MTTDIYVVRHGRTSMNVDGRFRGLLDPPLDDEGLREARGVAPRLRAYRPVHVYTSPLTRAQETAAEVTRAGNGEASVLDELRDLDFGSWAGLTAQEAKASDPAAFDAFMQTPTRAAPPGGEPLAAALRRLVQAIRSMEAAFPGRAVVAVTHDVPIRLLIAGATGLRGGDMWDLLVPTGAFVHLRSVDGHLYAPPPRPVLVHRRWSDVERERASPGQP